MPCDTSRRGGAGGGWWGWRCWFVEALLCVFRRTPCGCTPKHSLVLTRIPPLIGRPFAESTRSCTQATHRDLVNFCKKRGIAQGSRDKNKEELFHMLAPLYRTPKVNLHAPAPYFPAPTEPVWPHRKSQLRCRRRRAPRDSGAMGESGGASSETTQSSNSRSCTMRLSVRASRWQVTTNGFVHAQFLN